MPSPPRRWVGGFTLVEAMVVIGISVILMGLAVPSMRNLLESNGLSDSLDSLTGSIALARAEAIKRGVTVTICSSDAPKTGTVACGGAWSIGWIVFVDYDSDAAVSTKDTILRVQGSFERNGPVSSSTSSLKFNPTGGIAGVGVNFAFATPSTPTVTSKRVCVSTAGRVRVIDGATQCSS